MPSEKHLINISLQYDLCSQTKKNIQYFVLLFNLTRTTKSSFNIHMEKEWKSIIIKWKYKERKPRHIHVP